MTKKLAGVGSAVMLAATFGLVAAPAAQAVPLAPLNPIHWTVACDSIVGTIKFATALTLAPASSNNTITVKATASGCNVPQTGNVATGDPVNCVQPGVKKQSNSATPNATVTTGSTTVTLTAPDVFTPADGVDPVHVPGDVGATITGFGIPGHTTIASVTDSHHAVLSAAATKSASNDLLKWTTAPVPDQPCVNLAPAKLGGVLTSLAGHNQSPPIADSSGCLGLSGLSTGTSGSNVTQFKNNAKGLDNRTPLPKLLDSQGNANVTSPISATFGTTFSSDSWGASYGEFQIGASFGTPTVTRSGDAFEGSDSGHSDVFDGTTGQSSGAILIACLGKGVKLLNFGIGTASFG